LINKVEIFRNALEKTVGEDIQKVLWVKSQNSEIWLERRTSYTRSLAVMSMVGYILGLGDRHPSNIMLERQTGKIVHIDFGDCFEIAMRREKFPERIPFRLTRMLTKAMEVSGIEGNFRTTCENTMRVMRDNKESLLAIMEAFVYDPLISFRLLNPKMLQQMKEEDDKKRKEAQEENKPAKDEKKLPEIIIEEEIYDVVAQIEKNKKEAIRDKNIEKVMDKLQGPQKASMANMGVAESRFSARERNLELLQLMNTDDDEAQREKELNTVAEFVIQRITEKLKGQEIINAVKLTQQESQHLPAHQRRVIKVKE
jgi:FKBP12-rapamycin complex-associated protein